jgi:hypothetical protein
MPDADDGMRGSAVHPGQQSRPPLGEDVPPRLFGERVAEVADPVGGPARITQRLAQVGSGHGSDGPGQILQLVPVQVQPAVHGVRPAVRGERLHDHGGVMGEPAEPLRSRGVETSEGLF